MATTFYLNDATAPYTPTTYKGAWDDTVVAITRQLAVDKLVGGANAANQRSENTATVDFDVLLFRGVTGPLAAQTITGSLDVMLGVAENSASADLVYHIHAYVTQGNSDTVRGTLVADYVETTGNEWPVGTVLGKGLATAQTVFNVAASLGDRIVVEIGYRALNSLTTNFTGTLRYGGGASTTDLTAGAVGTSATGFITFSNTVTLAPVDARVAMVGVEVPMAMSAAVAAQVSQVYVEIPVLNYNPTPTASRRSQVVIVA